MPRRKLVDHKVHKYKKQKLGNKIIYRCAMPGCTHYLLRELVTNQFSLCWKCGAVFVLAKAVSLLGKYPWCEDCSKKRSKKKVVETGVPEDVMNKILGGFNP